jgi:hypothetical protein
MQGCARTTANLVQRILMLLSAALLLFSLTALWFCMLFAVVSQWADHDRSLQRYMQTDSLVAFDCITKEDVMQVLHFDGLVFKCCCSSSSYSAQVAPHKAEVLKVLVDTAAAEVTVTALLKVSS